jgi:hypothetical protein
MRATEVIVMGLGTPRSAGENFECTWKHLRAPAASLGAPTTNQRAPGSAHDMPGSTWERRRQVWEHLESQWSSLGKSTSSLGMLLICLQIIATTYRSKIFKTHVFSLYSHLCICIATDLHTVYLDWLQTALKRNSRCI